MISNQCRYNKYIMVRAHVTLISFDPFVYNSDHKESRRSFLTKRIYTSYIAVVWYTSQSASTTIVCVISMPTVHLLRSFQSMSKSQVHHVVERSGDNVHTMKLSLRSIMMFKVAKTWEKGKQKY